MPPVIHCTRFCSCCFIILPHTPSSGSAVQEPTRPLWGVVFLVSLVGQLCLDQISFCPLPPMPGIVCVWQICVGLNGVLTLHSPQRPCACMKWSKGIFIGQPKYWRHWKGCHFAVMQNSNTSMVVGASLFLSFTLAEQVHHCQLGALHLWDLCWSIKSTLQLRQWNWFITASISLHRFFSFLMFHFVADGQQVISV